MIASDVARCALHAALAALIFTGAVEIWHIVVIEALFGCAEAFFRPAQTGLLPQTVPEAEIQDARAASGTMETIAEFAGPSLATALVLGLGAGWAFAIDAATFLVSVAFLARVRARPRGAAVVRMRMAAELRAGWLRCASARGCGRSCSASRRRCCWRSRRGSRSARPWRSSTTAARACSACSWRRWAPAPSPAR